MKSILARIGFVVAFGAAASISFLVFVLLAGGIIFHFAQAVTGTIRFSTIDLTLPNSVKELVGGLILGMFLSVPVSIFLIPFSLLAHRIRKKAYRTSRTNPDKGYGFFAGLLACTFITIIFGGLLVFVVPSWIGVCALLVGATVAVVATGST